MTADDKPVIRIVVTVDGTVFVAAEDVAAWLESPDVAFVDVRPPRDQELIRRGVATMGHYLRERIHLWRDSWVGPRAVLSLAPEPGQVSRLSLVRNDPEETESGRG